MSNIEMDDLSLDKLDMGALDSPEMLGTEAAEWKKKDGKSKKPSFGDFDELDLPDSTGVDADYEYDYVEVTNEDIDRRGVPRGSSFGAPEPEPAKPQSAQTAAPAAGGKSVGASQFNTGLPNQAEIARNAFAKTGIEVGFVKKGEETESPAPAAAPAPKPAPAPPPKPAPKLSDTPIQVSIPGLPDLPPRPVSSAPASPAPAPSVPVSVPSLSDTPKQVSVPGISDIPKPEPVKTEIEIPALGKKEQPAPLPPEPEPEPSAQSVMLADMDAVPGAAPKSSRGSSSSSGRSSSSKGSQANDPASRRASKMNDGFDDFVVPYNKPSSGGNQQITRSNMLDIIQQQNIAEYEKGKKKVTVLGVLTIISGVITLGGALSSLNSISSIMSAAIGIGLIICAVMFMKGSDAARRALGLMHAYDFASGFIALGASIGLLNVFSMSGLDQTDAVNIIGTLLIVVGVVNLIINGVLTYFYLLDESVKRFTGGH